MIATSAESEYDDLIIGTGMAGLTLVRRRAHPGPDALAARRFRHAHRKPVPRERDRGVPEHRSDGGIGNAPLRTARGGVVNVVVVGAGISGLTAAFRIQQAGHHVRVLEAAEHPGGRMWTKTPLGLSLDTGAHLLLDSYERTKTLGLRPFESM
jgi:cation diffusion facilitator CzcD-associated flavoprotein CzcO